MAFKVLLFVLCLLRFADGMGVIDIQVAHIATKYHIRRCTMHHEAAVASEVDLAVKLKSVIICTQDLHFVLVSFQHEM